MPDINDYMLLSLDAYNDFADTEVEVNPTQWTRVNPTRPVAEGGLGLSTGWDADGFNAAAYKRGNEIVIAYRGWDNLDPNDVEDIFGGAYLGEADFGIGGQKHLYLVDRPYVGAPYNEREVIRDGQPFPRHQPQTADRG